MTLPLAAQAAFKTEARLLLVNDTARPGDTVLAGVQLRMAPKWHTYWRNPGDSGQATKIDWTLPPGVTAAGIQWPVPEKLVVSDLTTYVLHDSAVLLVPLRLASDLQPGPLELKAKVSWMECEEVCVLGGANVSATLTVGAEAKASKDAALIEAAHKRLPTSGASLSAQARWEAGGEPDARPLLLEFTASEPATSWDFFPYEAENLEIGGATERPSVDAGKVRLKKVVKKFDGEWPNQLAGLLVRAAAAGQPPTGYEVGFTVASLSPTPPFAVGSTAPTPTAEQGPRSLALMLVFAFLGGLILNIMPCVLPVIALKVLSFVQQSKEAPGRVRTLGLVYGLGVLASFLVLAGLAISVTSAGKLASWGMVLQNQAFRVILTVLITLVALNLFGLFEVTLSGGAMGAAYELTAKEGYPGAFFNGVLAAVLATPCTAPFLGAALAFAFTQPPLITILVFLFVGLGLAAPFVLLCWQPAWLKLLPKPGAWMEKFKIAIGFPMLATAVWLFWFTAPRFGRDGVLWLGLFLVVLAMCAWVWGEFVQRSTKRRGLAIGLAAAFLLLGYFYLLEGQLQWRRPLQKEAVAGSLKESPDGIDWQVWSPEAVAKARAAGHPVLVDFTADNCLNCKLNKKTSLEIKDTREKLKQINAVAFLADFTDADPRIAKVLQQYNRAGVPLVLVYPKDPEAAPLVLPTILTPKIVLDALQKAGR
jgi:thiol:disulfide interchange protein DsbD